MTNELDFRDIKARQKATWESGDFGQVAIYNRPAAEEFMGRLRIAPGRRVLDAACGSGNLAIIAARHGAVAAGVDFASNLIAQARKRMAAEGLSIDFREGDVEALPFADGEFDAVVSMFGAMFAPRPGIVAAELFRVTKPGGIVALANWTPEGFIGKMFEVFQAHLPPPPSSLPSVMCWGEEATVRRRLERFVDVQMARRIAVLRYPFPPAGTVEFFRRCYGPTGRAFDLLPPPAQESLRRALVELQSAHNLASDPGVTEVHAEYLEVVARR